MKRRILSLYLLITAIGGLWGDYPHIQSLKPSDILFRQMQSDIAAHYRALSYGKNGVFPPLAFFSYTRHPDDTIFTLAARLNLPYETIATLNGLSQAGEFTALQEIIIPNSPGIFLPEYPANSLEEIMAAWRENGWWYGGTVGNNRMSSSGANGSIPWSAGIFLKSSFSCP